jgi:two-component system NarL family sensor kinase
MDKPEALEFIHLLYTGVVTMLVLVIAVVLFVVVHQKNAHLLQVQLRQQELAYETAMLQSVVASQENERERIAQDLHDEIGASLSAARLFVNQVHYEVTVPHLQEMSQQASQILGDTLQNVRHIAQNLSPLNLEKFGFCHAVTILARQLEGAGLQVDIRVDEAVERLGSNAQLALYRIVQEAFTNSIKHARAQCLTLWLRPEAEQLSLSISDDGCGFVPELDQATSATSMGLAGMQARTRLLNGQLEIRSIPGKGTELTLRCPR